MENVLKKLHNVQLEIQSVTKNAENPFYNSTYADLNNVKDALQAYLEVNKLMTYHQIKDGKLVTTLHDVESGESISTSIEISMTDPQKKGAEITYYRRYNLIALFDLKVEDDDANLTVNKPSNNKFTKVDIWMTDKVFENVKELEKSKIQLCLNKYDNKTSQKDGKV